MNEEPVTILMPVCNSEKFLRESIDSILSQSLHDLEFIIINDGSTDKSDSIITSYNDQRIIIVRNQTNSGLIHSLNKGLQLASGKYIARMDADDISYPNRIKTQRDYLEANPSIDVCGTWICKFDEHKKNVWKTPEKDADIKANLLFNSAIAHPSVMFRGNSLKRHNICYDKLYPHAEDYALWVEHFDDLKYANIPEVLLDYRRHQENITIKHDAEKTKSADRVRLNFLKKMGLILTEEELNLHSNIARWNFDCSRNFVQQSHKLLLKILSANKQHNFLPHHCMSKVLADRWYSICYNAHNLGFWTYKKFLRSPLKNNSLSLLQKMVFAKKCFFNSAKI